MYQGGLRCGGEAVCSCIVIVGLRLVSLGVIDVSAYGIGILVWANRDRLVDVSERLIKVAKFNQCLRAPQVTILFRLWILREGGKFAQCLREVSFFSVG